MKHRKKKVSLQAEVWAKTGGKCWYCGKQTNPYDDFTIDHIIPENQGGDPAGDNAVPCCKSCNSRKSNRSIEELRRFLTIEHSPVTPLTDEQISFLRQHGIEIPATLFPKFEFYFERLQREQASTVAQFQRRA